jgi:hypothetical protein
MRWLIMSRVSNLNILVCGLFLAGCASQPQVQPSAAAPSTANGASTCDPHVFMEQVKQDIPYAENSLLHNDQYGLTLWAVDPTLDSSATAAQAAEAAARLTFLVVNDNSCMRTSFPVVTATIVDSHYHAWFIGSVETASVPVGRDLTDEELAKLTQAFPSSPLLNPPVAYTEPAAPSEGACTWEEARHKLLSYYSPAGPNIDFTFVIDQDGANVWAQWEGPDPQLSREGFLSGMQALQTELRCLYPPVDILWMIYTDTDGMVSLIQSIDGDSLRNSSVIDLPNHLESIYPPAAS